MYNQQQYGYFQQMQQNMLPQQQILTANGCDSNGIRVDSRKYRNSEHSVGRERVLLLRADGNNHMPTVGCGDGGKLLVQGGTRVMKIIEKLSELIEEEIEDAEKYAKLALELKGTNDEMAKMFYGLSTEEMEHMNKLHSAVVNTINDYRAKNGEAPPEMKMVYDILHKRHIEDAGAVKALQMLYKGQ